MPDKTTHFGYQNVSPDEKTQRVGAVFDSVANNYDVMNDVMSFGMHRIWKRYFINLVNVKPHNKILDLAAGTGDISALLAAKLNGKGSITLCDPNASMLERGRARLVDKGLLNNIHFVQSLAEHLPFPEDYFDCITLAFGLRNFTDKSQALTSLLKVIKPGGQLLILEFSQPQKWMRKAYDAYSFNFLPKMGKIIAKDEDSYKYLVESIRKHPDQDTLKTMLEEAGFENCEYFNLSGGIICIHRSYKF